MICPQCSNLAEPTDFIHNTNSCPDCAKEILLDEAGTFGWSFGEEFFIETKFGNFVWWDPEYGGDNTVTEFDGNIKAYCKSANIPFVRDKGKHTLQGYMGTDWKIVPASQNH